jgi:hypothetical protein
MRIRLFFPVLTSALLMSFSTAATQAGSFFGPCCYGADYAYQYPNRANNVIGCGPGAPCQARHPIFKHRLFRRNQAAPNDGMAANAMSGYGMPVNGMQVNGMPMNATPIEYVQGPAGQLPMPTPPVHMTSVATAPVPVAPAVQSRLTPVPAPMPSGPISSEPPTVDASGKPPF